MGNEEGINSSVPVIDLKEFGESESEKAYKKLREACEEWGCFRIINHPIPTSLMSEMKTAVRSLFDLPIEIKQRNVHVIPGISYVAPTPMNPLMESFSLNDFGSTKALRSFCDQLDASTQQREIIEKYAGAMHELAFDIGRKLAKSIGLESDTFEGYWPCQFRMNKYNFTPQSVGSTAVTLHTDPAFLTILQDDENVGGLELMNKSGDFVPVNPWPGTLLFNLGDIGKAWSNGRFFNVKHRVECKEACSRISIATFMLGPRDKAVETSPELVDDDHHRLYQPFNYEDYWRLRISNFKTMRAGEALEFFRANI